MAAPKVFVNSTCYDLRTRGQRGTAQSKAILTLEVVNELLGSSTGFRIHFPEPRIAKTRERSAVY